MRLFFLLFLILPSVSYAFVCDEVKDKFTYKKRMKVVVCEDEYSRCYYINDKFDCIKK